METLFIVLGSILAVILITYGIVSLISGSVVVKSKIVKLPCDETADHYYYLPAHSMMLKATAVVQVNRLIVDQTISDPILVQLALEPTVEITADTSRLVTLSYKGNWFSNDELDITTSSKGLLQNIAATTEDRLGSTIAQLIDATGAPSAARAPMKFSETAASPAEKTITEIMEFTRTFSISVEEAGSARIPKTWIIPINGAVAGSATQVDASFSLICPSNEKARTEKHGTFDGILTRPLIQKKYECWAGDLKGVSSFVCLVPDRHSLITIPMKRIYFVKWQQTPRLADGLLVQNHIVKPSQAEGLVSIPVNIAKAIFSIPAQLLQFKITRMQQQSKYDQSMIDLLKAQQDLQKARQDDASQQPAGHQVPGEGEQPKLPPLGKKAAEEPPRRENIFRLLEKKKAAALAAIPTDFPPSRFWNDKFSSWQDYQNTIDGIQDCVPAAAAHMISCWTSQALSGAVVVDEKDVIAAYTRESHYDPKTGENDDGCILSRFLNNWKSQGMGERKVMNYARLAKQDKDELKLSIFYFGPCMVGLKMPETAQTQPNKWELTVGTATLSANSGSWGGHCVAAVGYNETSLLVVSWGRLITVDWKFYETYNDESYAVLSGDWLKDGKTSPTPASKDIAVLQSTLHELQA